jgi:hypothetical protein
MMDDLDRLAARVARTVRARYPQLIERGFTPADLEERLAPFADVRRELADGSPSGYQSALLRLLSGERGYLAADVALQEGCRSALRTASPALSLVRTWGRSAIALQSGALALAGDGPGSATAAGGADGGAADRPVPAPASPAAPLPVAAGGPLTGVADTARGVDCVHCGGGLPTGLVTRFCPHCGLDLTVRHCPACSTELERAWRFCVTCGRRADDGAPVGTGADEASTGADG